MDLDALLGLLRRTLSDVDDTSADAYGPDVLLSAVDDARRAFVVRQVAGLDGYTVDVTAGTWTPDVTDADAWLLVTKAALDLLSARYRQMVKRGEFGIIWRSGLESESSIEAAKAYRTLLAELERQVQELLAIRARRTFATRPQ